MVLASPQRGRDHRGRANPLRRWCREVLIALNDVPAVIGVLQTLGILLISLLMLTGAFPRGLAWLGVATGAIGMVSEVLRPVLGSVYALNGVLLFVWLIWIAFALWRLGAETLGQRSPS